MSILVLILVLAGLLVTGGLCWYYRGYLKNTFNKNKKKIVAIGTAGALLSIGGSGLLIPEGYRPPTETLIRNSNGNYWAATGANIQNAIDDLTTPGTVWLPSGTITIDAELNLDDDIALVGCGVGATTIYSDESGAFDAINIIGKSNVTLKSFTLDMNSKGQQGIYVTSGAVDVRIDDIYIYHYGLAQGIYCTGGANHIYISNLKIVAGDVACKHGIGMTGVNDSRVDNAVFINNYPDVSEDAFDVGGANDCHNITYNNIDIYGWYDGCKVAGSDTGAKNVILSNIKIHGVDNIGLKLQGQYVTVDGFFIENCPKGIASNTGGDHMNICNGFIRNCGIGLYLADGSPENVSVSNVEIDTTTTYGIALKGKNMQFTNVRTLNAGTYNKISTGSSYILMDNCIFLNGGNIGLSIDGSSHFKITNCIIKGNTGVGLATTLVACNNYTIMGCTFEDNGEALDTHASDDWNIITLNTVVDGETFDANSKTKGITTNNLGADI